MVIFGILVFFKILRAFDSSVYDDANTNAGKVFATTDFVTYCFGRVVVGIRDDCGTDTDIFLVVANLGIICVGMGSVVFGDLATSTFIFVGAI